MGNLLLSGDILYPEGLRDGWIHIEKGLIQAVSEGERPEFEGDCRHIEGVIIPGLIDLHTHMGDHLARGAVPPTLEEAVFPGGYKHRKLEQATYEDIVDSISNSIMELQPGVTEALDFREGGKVGMNALREATTKHDMRVIGLGRPARGEDITDLLELSDGLGIPSITNDLDDIRELARGDDKIFAVHASEGFRDDIDLITRLEPDLVIHMIKGTREDWNALSRESIPVAVCPRSNLAFGLDVPLDDMLDEGLRLGLGTDNSMTSVQDIFSEMKCAWNLLHRSGDRGSDPAREVFEMAAGSFIGGSRLEEMISSTTRWWEGGWPDPGDAPLLSVVRRPDDDKWKQDPFSHIVRCIGQEDLLFTGPGWTQGV
ncbi:MAG: amidohydrolase family protein [Thermoplasmata archaeon]|nr:amidohydrolase family protein [Thermoplasmata archaeon]